MGIPMGIPMGMGMGWVLGLKFNPHGSPAYKSYAEMSSAAYCKVVFVIFL